MADLLNNCKCNLNMSLNLAMLECSLIDLHGKLKYTKNLAMLVDLLIGWKNNIKCLNYQNIQSQLNQQYFYLIKKMKTKDLHCAIPRAIMRIFMNIKIPERYVSEVFDLSLENIRDESSSIAERAFSVKTAVNICEKHRELSNEFFIVLDDLRKYTSIPAIVSTIRYASKKLNR